MPDFLITLRNVLNGSVKEEKTFSGLGKLLTVEYEK
jgi:hypothetical protein